MLNNFIAPEYHQAFAEITLLFLACGVMVVDMFFGKTNRWLAYFATIITLVITSAVTCITFDGSSTLTFSNLFVDDVLADVLKLLTYLSVIISLILGRDYIKVRGLDKGEFYLLVLFSTLGMMIMISSAHFLSMYLGVELLSLSMYALVAIDRHSVRSTEAAMKYFVLGALASGLLLYGMSMIYGATGTLEISGVAQYLNQNHGAVNSKVLIFGLVFLVSGIAFKLGVVPFHMWIPDVYHGAPTAVTMLLATAPKLAAFAMLMRLLVYGLLDLAVQWQQMLMVLAVLSIALGNLTAIAQTNIKRMLAYSAISHMGFLSLAMICGVLGDGLGRNLAYVAYTTGFYYVVVYVLMSLGVFGLLLLLTQKDFEAEEISDLKGLNKRSPWFALMMLVLMISMAGIPFFVGFFSKFAVLTLLVAANHTNLAVFAVVFSLIGAFYYLRIIKVMYFDEPVANTPLTASLDAKVIVSALALAVAVFGIFPDGLLRFCQFVLASSL